MNYHENYPLHIHIVALHKDSPKNWVDKYGNKKLMPVEMIVETMDWHLRPDAQVGNFGMNFYFRPEYACRKNFKGYKTLKSLRNAIKNLLSQKGFTSIWFEDEPYYEEVKNIR